ncbi:MAG TPA: DUF2834 domain-containing protein [Blastocatellia bacterium]|nr:DUF2834 domain-containing protein [Blastocatellia bacterium]
MRLKNLYLILAVIGLAAPYYFFISFLMTHGLDARALVAGLFANHASSFFVIDLLISSVVFLCYLRQESARQPVPYWGLYVVALFAVGLSFALPLFLYARASRLESNQRAAGASS